MADRHGVAVKREDKMELEPAAREIRLAEQEITRQGFDEKNKRIWELEKRIEILEGMLNRAAAFGGGFPQPQPFAAIKKAPRRWAVK